MRSRVYTKYGVETNTLILHDISSEDKKNLRTVLGTQPWIVISQLTVDLAIFGYCFKLGADFFR